MKILFMSDAHLADPQAPHYRRVVSFLDALPADLDKLVINGDFFDCWFGPNLVAERINLPILQRLDGLVEKGTEVVYVEGNHDFRLQEVITKRGYRLVTDEWRSTLFGQRVLVVHGDLVTGDIWYRMMHSVLRGPVMAGVNAILPDEVSLRLGLSMSHYSRVRDRDTELLINQKIMDHAATLENVDVFITGHTHIPFDETIAGKNGPVRVINLGDWVTNFSYLWVENGSWELRRA